MLQTCRRGGSGAWSKSAYSKSPGLQTSQSVTIVDRQEPHPPHGVRSARRSRLCPAVRYRSSRRRGRSPHGRSRGRTSRGTWRQGERRPGLADDERPADDGTCHSRQSTIELTSGDVDDFLASQAHELGGAARHDGQVALLAPEDGAFVERPMHRTVQQPHESTRQDGAIQPEIHGDDRQRLHRCRGGCRAARARRAPPVARGG